MVTAAMAMWALGLVVFGLAAAQDVALGVAGPLVAVVLTWVAIVGAHRRDPALVTGVLLRGFAGKMVFFGVYVVAIWLTTRPEPVAFMASFTGAFLVLYMAEAVLLQRLSASGPRSSFDGG